MGIKARLRRLEERENPTLVWTPIPKDDVAALDVLAAIKREQLVSAERFNELCGIFETRGALVLMGEAEACELLARNPPDISHRAT